MPFDSDLRDIYAFVNGSFRMEAGVASEIIDGYRRIAAVQHLCPRFSKIPDSAITFLLQMKHTVHAKTTSGTVCEIITQLDRDFRTLHTFMCQAATVNALPPTPSSFARLAYPFVHALRLPHRVFQINSICIEPSATHGLGVFATRSIGLGEIVTTYPIDAVCIVMDKMPTICGRCPYTIYYRDPRYNGTTHAEDSWGDYRMSCAGTFISVFADPDDYAPERCGHLINSPLGTNRSANCMPCFLFEGRVVAVCTTRAIGRGEELLMYYTDEHWQ